MEPLVPPDPQAIHAQRTAEQEGRRQQLRAFIYAKVLPVVNKRLSNNDSVRRDWTVGPFSVSGFSGSVLVSSEIPAGQWMDLLIEAFQGPVYQGYEVGAVARWFVRGSDMKTRDLGLINPAEVFYAIIKMHSLAFAFVTLEMR